MANKRENICIVCSYSNQIVSPKKAVQMLRYGSLININPSGLNKALFIFW